MSKGTGKVPTQSQTMSAGPWSGQAPHLMGLYQRAAELPMQQYNPESTYAAQGPETQQALGMTAATARGGANQPAVDQWNQTVGGDYLYGGPGFNAALKAAGDTITPMVQGQFEAGGRYGGGLAQEAETSALANAFASQYGQERQNQLAAMSMGSPAYRDAAQLGQVGTAQDAYQQGALDDQTARWNFAQQAPYDQLQAQSGVIQAGYPGSQSAQQGYGPPGLLDIFGADLAADAPWGFSGIGAVGNIWDRVNSYGDI